MSQSSRALIIGVSQYKGGITPLPAVAADTSELSKLLGSSAGAFEPTGIRVLSDEDATRDKVVAAMQEVFGNAGPDDTIFVYFAGHGDTDGSGEYYYVPHDGSRSDLSGSAVPLRSIKEGFDTCRSEKVLLWLDFCHSGGILARDLSGSAADSATKAVERSLEVVRGRGKVILCACTADQKAYEDAAHGHFTRYLIKGLQGEAANSSGEVTVSSLHDYIDANMGSAAQRPMFFGHLTGRIVLMHSRGPSTGGRPPARPTAKPAASLVVADSGPWVMLGNTFFESSEVNQAASGELEIQIPSGGAQDDAAVRALSADRWSRPPIPYAYRNDALVVRVKETTSRSLKGQLVWKVTLTPEPMEYGGGQMSEMACSVERRTYSADEIAGLRARRILLNDPPAKKREGGRSFDSSSMLDILIRSNANSYPVESGVFQRLDTKLKAKPELYLRFARLLALFDLRAGQVFELVIDLRFGPISDGKIEVFCHGKRRKKFTNRPRA